jgi:electron transfer flavoprotein beta subunit
MKIVVLLKMVPDVVEELELGPDGRSLDLELLRLIINERDEHALEQALLLKERHGGTVTVVALDAPEIDDVLFTALARGVDRVVKIEGAPETLTTHGAASLLAGGLPDIPDLLPADLLLTGCQAMDDLDAQTGPFLAQRLGLPYVGVISGVEVDLEAQRAFVSKEYPGGMHGDFEVTLPALLGIQAAATAPRYVPVAKVRAAMQSGEVEAISPSAQPEPPLVEVLKMMKLEAAGHAEMLEGSVEEVAGRVAELLGERGLL